jgi:hypothetical protein
MAEKWYRIPIANSVIKLSSIEFITPVTESTIGSTTLSTFRIVHHTSVISIGAPQAPSQTQVANAETSNTGPVVRFSDDGAGARGSGPNSVTHANNELVIQVRNDLINALTDNGLELINNFPDL